MDRTEQLARIRQMCRTGDAKAIRVASGTTLREAAAATRSSAPTLYRWENGGRPTGDAAIRYFELLERLRRILRREVPRALEPPCSAQAAFAHEGAAPSGGMTSPEIGEVTR